MLEAALSEFSAYGETEGGCPYVDAYWQKSYVNWQCLFLEGEVPDAFARVRAPEERGVDFSIILGSRRRGYGREMATAVMRRRPGSWRVGIRAGSEPAKASGQRPLWQTAHRPFGTASTRKGCSIASPSPSSGSPPEAPGISIPRIV